MSCNKSQDVRVIRINGKKKQGVRLILWALLLSCAGCGKPVAYSGFEGATMGTYYRLQYRLTSGCEPNQQRVDGFLIQFNKGLSTYIEDSEISEINAAPAGRPLPISPRFAQVLDAAMQVQQQTGGAFDVTVGPLVNLWGFGPEDRQDAPSLDEQARAGEAVGMNLISMETANGEWALVKAHPNTYIDLSALAKGFAVDELAQQLRAAGCGHFMVDIGGEVSAQGHSPSGRAWRIGVEAPAPDRPGSVQRVLSIDGQAVATSGDYRNFREIDGLRIDHVFDPRSRRPADNAVASATVIHPQAMFADAYATALMVLGVDEGLALAKDLDLPVLIIAKSADGRFVERYTPAMQPFLVH
jgi:thiamine biosynthesis lipoprotein